MGIKQTANLAHWNYYIALEQDLAQTSRFIEFTEANFSVYSIELVHLFLATSSEVDVVLKALCNIIKPEKNHRNIEDYKKTVKERLPGLINEVCYIPRFGLELNPWSNWNKEDNPIWWQSHNNVKHHRDVHFNEANLKNTLNSMAALSIEKTKTAIN